MLQGVNSVPDVTFTILDACRDYQFRVITVLRNKDREHRLLVYRPRAIPVDLPTFAVAPRKVLFCTLYGKMQGF
ncbi:unnamed protein product [Gongylonema pulchrum]|uniref:Piwi domain-containing protein n=1 Tax=Gongylonema pulchrum TaxID=637853 RepID=A0A183EDM9_9BILA|nr:unnamed protein product [Gongylonema pulchrum]